jgi:flagellar protein FliO/FliZ
MTLLSCRLWRLQPGVLLWLLVVASAGAHADTMGKASAELFDSAYLMQVFGSLLLVFACLFGLLFVLRKMNGVPTMDRKVIRVLGSVKLGSREKIALIEAGGQQLLVGIAAGSVNSLHVFKNPIDSEIDAAPSGADFASLLRSSKHSDKS